MSVHLLTGATGFLGRAIRKLASDEEIFSVDVEAGDPSVSRMDLLAENDLNLLPSQIATAIHLAAVSNDKACRLSPLLAWETNLLATLKLYEACKQRGCKKFVFASTEWVYGDQSLCVPWKESARVPCEGLGTYALSKLATENALLQIASEECPVLIFRLAILYGPRTGGFSAVESIIHHVMENKPVEVQSGKTARCYLHVEDAASAFLRSIHSDLVGIWNLAGTHLVSLEKIYETACELTGNHPAFLEKNPSASTIRNLDGAQLWNFLQWEPREIRAGVADILRRFKATD